MVDRATFAHTVTLLGPSVRDRAGDVLGKPLVGTSGWQVDAAVIGMTTWDSWLAVALPGGGTFELPAAVAVPRAGTGIDSAAREFTGAGVSVLVDRGPFASTPAGHGSAPEYVERTVRIDGLAASIATYREADGRVLAARIPGAGNLTVVVRSSGPVPPDVAERIVSSVRR